MLEISKNISIIGPGANKLAIDGSDSTSIFEDRQYAINTVLISGLELKHGKGNGYGSAIGGLGYLLTVRNCNIHSNYIGSYGTISAWSSPEYDEMSYVTIENSSIHNNTSSGHATALYMSDGTGIEIKNSTIYNNHSIVPNLGHGHALWVDGGDVRLINVTIAGHDEGIYAVAIRDATIWTHDFDHITGETIYGEYTIEPSLYISNCIFENEVDNLRMYISGQSSEGNSLSNDDSMKYLFHGGTVTNNISSLLDTLGIKDNGGTTPTIALQCGSPAIDAGSSTTLHDQRDSIYVGTARDIGAFESSPFSVTSYGTDTRTECVSFEWIDGKTYSSNNQIATHLLESINGCDSIVRLDLTFVNIDNSLTIAQTEISANEVHADFQWINCNLNDAFITGEVSQTYIFPENGLYRAEITKGSCTVTSDCYETGIVSGISSSLTEQLNIYPNPTNGIINISFQNEFNNYNVKILSINGNVLSNTEINGNNETGLTIDGKSGLYFIEVSSASEKATFKIIKK